MEAKPLKPLRTAVYIDGFNFYYGALQGGHHKWLDLHRFSELLLQPHNQIVSIKYFTAKVADHGDLGAPERQRIYLRALEIYRPNIKVIYGHFLSHTRRMRLANAPKRGPKTVEVIKTEEKGSDVNLAVHLVTDAWLDVYDCAVVISNDGDLAEALCQVKKHKPRKVIGVVYPLLNQPRKASHELRRYADFQKEVRASALAAAQLPSPIPTTAITRPVEWDPPPP